MADMKGELEINEQLLTRAENENILLADELHLKSEQ
jgi:hypothetical protein